MRANSDVIRAAVSLIVLHLLLTGSQPTAWGQAVEIYWTDGRSDSESRY